MDPDGKWTSTWAVLLAAAGQNRWPFAEMKRPEFSGGIDPTEGWSHASTEEVSR